MKQTLKFAIFLTHPIQYWVPILRELATFEDIELRVYYLSMHSVEGGVDPGFGQKVKWDVPLLEGYPYFQLENLGSGPKGHGFFRYRARHLAKLFKDEQFDAILIPGYFCYYYLQVLAAAMYFKIPIYFRGDNKDRALARNPLKSWLRQQFLRCLYSRFRGLFATATYMKESFLAHGVAQERIFWAPHCVDSGFFEQKVTGPAIERTLLRANLGVAESATVFLLCGKLIAEKNPLLLLQAASRISGRHALFILFVGDGPLREVVEQEARHLGIPYRIVGFKNQTELPDYYQAGDIVVLPSKSETWGLVINEAMIFGKPVVVSDAVGCADDLVRDQGTGFVFQSGSVEDLSRALEQAIESRAAWDTMGRSAQALIQNYSPRVNAVNIHAALLK